MTTAREIMHPGVQCVDEDAVVVMCSDVRNQTGKSLVPANALHLEVVWSSRQDLNLGPTAYQTDALSS